MSTDVIVADQKYPVGTRVAEIELLDLFPPSEGEIDQIYGRIGQGKTYDATRQVINSLNKGRVVYTNWKLNWNGFDQRDSMLYVILALLGLKKQFYVFKKENLRYIDIDDEFIDNFEKLTDCEVYLDEGHVIFDSYQHAKFSMQKRKAILHTRHFNRKIVIITQRPTAIHVSARANVNRFYKVERLTPAFLGRWGIILFKRTEFQDFTDESVDEEKPLAVALYFASKRILNSYNSKYLRGGIEKSQTVEFEAYNINYGRRIQLLLMHFYKIIPSIKIKNPLVRPVAAPRFSEAPRTSAPPHPPRARLSERLVLNLKHKPPLT